MKRVFISDCEGPISKNDNAFEITSHFVPHGDRLFTVTSRYDDMLAEVLRRRGHKAGDTLKLVLPFLKAYDVTDQDMKEFSSRNLVLIANAKNTLRFARSIAPTYIVSTSYEHYLKALCQSIKFPFSCTYCTKITLDKYDLTRKERIQLIRIAREIAAIPVFEILPQAKGLADLPEEAHATIQKLDQIFCEQIGKMHIGEIYSEVNPVGGVEKAEAIRDVVRKQDVSLADVMYVGDSITDEEAFKLVKRNGGLTVSFNGNQHAVKNAEVALLSADSTTTAVIADLFIRLGKRKTLDLVANWGREALQGSQVNKSLLDMFLKLHPHKLPKAKIVTRENRENLSQESGEFRKKIRGEAVGRLG